MKFLCMILVASFAITIVSSSSSSSSIREWEILTKHNFSSQIRLHPHILLLLTLPWSGESRSLMKDLSHSLLIPHNQHQFQSLKLMLLHRNTDKILADSIDASTDLLTLVYFHHSISYKYKGRLKPQNILSSLFPYISLPPHEVPLKSLNTHQDFSTFLHSTDKALVLVDFCGWTPTLLPKTNKNGTRSSFAMQGGFSGGNDIMSFSNSRMKINQKVSEGSMCKADLNINKGFCEAPWLGDFASVNDGEFTSSCSSEEFERFHSFYLKFMTTVRDFFLPPERHSFGLVSDRAMLSSLGVGDSGLWFAVHYIAGCSSCSTILKEEDDLNYVMKMDNYYVKELEGNGYDQEPILPVNKPSVLLFVDRSSNSSETRGKSKEALGAFRVLAQHYHVVGQTGKKNNEKVYHIQDQHGLKSTSDHPRLNLPVTAQTNKLKEKMSSIVIINGDKQVRLDSVASDLQASSLKEILGYLLQKKEKKLSSLAKDLGFQLLSDDIDIKSANSQQLQSEVQLNQISTEKSQEIHTDTVKLDDDPHAYAGELEEEYPNLTELPYQHNEVKTPSTVTSEEIKPVQAGESVAYYELSTAKVIKSETNGSSDGNNSGGEKAQLLGFNGSFFYSDGNYQLLERLTGGCRLPSLVIVDPLLQQHYVYPEENLFDFSSLGDFISKFVNGILLPYQRSDHIILGQREATRPPFVNLDFHEVDSIPRITTHTFSELVIGFNLSGKENISDALNKDVLVLFSNSWCAFCQRMEMVVREVYRSIKGYLDMLKNGSRNVKGISEHESLDYVTMKLPLIYLLDCTLNECDLILKSVHQREVYPALVLFPAGKKQPFLYEGDMAVVDVMKFMAEHGSNFHHLIKEKVAVLWRSVRVPRNQNLYDTLQPDIHDESLHTRNKYHAAPGHERMLEQMVRPNLMSSPVVSNGLHETLPQVVIGSVLIATEKLVGSRPFDGSMILIVAADHITGFQGLIINKNIEWSFLPEFEKGFEKLKKAPLSFGGPVAKSGMPLLSLTRTASRNSLHEILPGIYFLNQVLTIQKIEELKTANQAIGGDYWFFVGYSSWGWKQLYDEMAEGAWNLSEDGASLLKWPGL